VVCATSDAFRFDPNAFAAPVPVRPGAVRRRGAQQRLLHVDTMTIWRGVYERMVADDGGICGAHGRSYRQTKTT